MFYNLTRSVGDVPALTGFAKKSKGTQCVLNQSRAITHDKFFKMKQLLQSWVAFMIL